MTKRSTIEFPGYTLTDARAYYTDGDQIALPIETRRHGTLYSFYTFGSAAGYAIRYGESPDEAVARELERGNKIYWLNLNATTISNQNGPKKSYPLQMWGDVVQFHGRKFQLVKDRHSNNAHLVEVEA
jgi:hypothetical protein